MSGRPGYLRIWAGTIRLMTAWSLRRPAFWWILLGAPLGAWLVQGRIGAPLLPLAVSTVSYAVPGALLAVWLRSEVRRGLALFLFQSRAGRSGLLVPELLFPAAAGAAVSLGFCGWMTLSGTVVPWQTWALVPFSALTASSLTALAVDRRPLCGGIVLLAAFLLQASGASWAGSSVYRLVLTPGYLLRSAEWAAGGSAPIDIHGDIFLFFSVLEAVALVFLVVHTTSGGPKDGRRTGSRIREE